MTPEQLAAIQVAKDSSANVDFEHPEANMYGCLPCPKCGSRYRFQLAKRKLAWARAVTDGRVVRFNDGLTFKSYPTVFEAEQAAAWMRVNGDSSAVVVNSDEDPLRRSTP